MAVTVSKGFPWAAPEEDRASSSESGSNSDSENEELAALLADGEVVEEIVNEKRKQAINNKEELMRKMAQLKESQTNLDWVERLDIATERPVVADLGEDARDDFKREMGFYAQALSAAQQGIKLLQQNAVPIVRPDDYFAEMLKSDEHMKRVRIKQIRTKEGVEKSIQAKRQRELKKFGKQVQTEVAQSRQKTKREDLERIKEIRKGRATAEDADEFDVSVKMDEASGSSRKRGRESDNNTRAKRQKRDEKYGFGGKKRGVKRNDAKSSADMSGFSMRKNKQQNFTSGGSGGAAKKRPGKARRQNMRK